MRIPMFESGSTFALLIWRRRLLRLGHPGRHVPGQRRRAARDDPVLLRAWVPRGYTATKRGCVALECYVAFLRKYGCFACSLVRALEMGRCLHRFEREEGGEDGGLPIGLKNTEMCLDASPFCEFRIYIHMFVFTKCTGTTGGKKITYVIMTLVQNVKMTNVLYMTFSANIKLKWKLRRRKQQRMSVRFN